MKYVKLFSDTEEIFSSLTDEDAGKLIKAVFAYVNGKEPALEGMLNSVFVPIRQGLDRSIKKYEETVTRNQTNGKNGGRPHKNPVGYFETQPVISKPKKSQDEDEDEDEDEEKENIKNNGKNSLSPLTQEERYEIALSRRVAMEDVVATERQVLNPENISKYDYKTTFYTIEKWLDRAIVKGEHRTLDETGMMALTGLYGKGATQ